ncbi:MAG: hypothetical protein H6563_12655 [Lewinellaceae bacterium]|nr:hypothetical protein [Lewinellaceae bacterium]
MSKKGLLLVGLGLWATLAKAQPEALSNLRTASLEVRYDWQELDSLSLFPASVEVAYADSLLLDPAFFQLRDRSIRFLPEGPLSEGTPVRITYRVLPWNLSLPLSRLDLDRRDTLQEGPPRLEYNPFEEGGTGLLPSYQGLDYNGSFARGISFGNRQNLVLNSRFNLQMGGIIGDGIEVQAALSDENIPIQPEGNTQQLSEIDRVFIQLKKGNTLLTAGDYELRRPEGYFMNYLKKLQGATFDHRQELLDGRLRLQTQASVAVARGKFARNTIQGQEGNQGPYRLQGANGERFIIILAGTEKVFIDGRVLQRGLDADYVIDYNRGDVTFTNRRLITKDIRIIVEFEYNDQRYSRSLYALNTRLESDRWQGYVNLYSEQDGRRAIGDDILTPEQIDILKNAGDDPSKAVVSGIDTIGTNPDPITYRLVDTLVGTTVYPGVLVFHPPTGSDPPLYIARFSDLGPGKGNYIRLNSDANGFVYAWVAPDPLLGKQGRYEPVIQLVPPQQLQLFTAGGAYQLSKEGRIEWEGGASFRNQNRFSTLDQQDDWGIAGMVAYRDRYRLGERWRTAVDARYEWTDPNFQALNPYRDPEFSRDWNVANSITGAQHLGSAGFQLANDSLGGRLGYHLSAFLQPGQYEGLRQAGQLSINRPAWDLDIQANYLQSKGAIEETRFFRPNFKAEKRFPKLQNWGIGAYGEREQNRRRYVGADTLSSFSFYYDLLRLYVKSPESEKGQTTLTVSQRSDFVPLDQDFLRSSRARELKWEGFWQAGRSSRVGWDLNYRKLQVSDTSLVDLDPAETYLGRIDYSLVLFKGAFRYSSNYQLGSGQEQKLFFIYRPVIDGAGLYQHIDFNGDGQEQVNEFVLAPNPDEGTHERIVLFSNEFIRTNNVLFNQSLRLEPRAVWFGQRGVRKLISRFSSSATWQITRNVRDLEGVSPWNPFQLDVTDTALVSTRTLIQNTLFFNQNNPVYDLQASWTDQQSKLILTTGLEGRRNIEQTLRGRWNLSRAFSLQLSASRGWRISEREAFPDQNYEIRFFKLEPRFSWLPSSSFRSIFGYRYEQSENQGGAQEKGTFHDFKVESTYNQSSKTSLRLSLSFVQVAFDGETTSAVGFAFLNGLQKGRNYLWSLSLDRQIARNVRMSLSYEGRKTGTARVVHVGRAQMAATF